MFRNRFTALLVAALTISGINASAMSVTPIIIDLDAYGSRSSESVQVLNPTEDNMPVEILIQQIEIDQTGTIVSSVDAADDFLILPPLSNIPAGVSQSFRIQYLGEPDLEEGRLFRFSVDQIPVQEEEEGNNLEVQVVYSISGLITLSVPSGLANVEMTEVKVVDADDESRRPQVTLYNSGTNYAYFSRGQLALRFKTPKGKTIWRETLSGEYIKKEIGVGLIPPGRSRTFTLLNELPHESGTLEASFDLDR